MQDTITDPLAVLGLTPGVDEAELRKRYLELVRLHPPEREPDRFREIHAAYQLAQDPLLMARKLLSTPVGDVTEWSDVIDQHSIIPPTLSVDFLLSLGNRDDDRIAGERAQASPSKKSNGQSVEGPSNE
jgi:hypothetical protein